MINALKYTKGTVYIKLVKGKNGRPELTISNESDCFEKEDLINIFDRFFIMDKARTTTSTGLGLFIVKVLVERINGTITPSYFDGIFSIMVTV